MYACCRKALSMSVIPDTKILDSNFIHCSDVEPTPQRPSCLTSCGVCCKERVWLHLKKFLTFTIPSGGVFGTIVHLLGCLLAFFSFFTISYQVFYIFCMFVVLIKLTIAILVCPSVLLFISGCIPEQLPYTVGG